MHVCATNTIKLLINRQMHCVALQSRPQLEVEYSNRDILESGHQFYDGKYKIHFDNISINLKRFGEDWARRLLLFDSEGSLKFNAHLGNESSVILYHLFQIVSSWCLLRILCLNLNTLLLSRMDTSLLDFSFSYPYLVVYKLGLW